MSGAPDPWGSPSPSRGPWLWLALMVGVTALAAGLAWRFPDALRSAGDWRHLLYLVGLLALVSSGVVAARRLDLRRSLKQVLAWIILALVPCIYPQDDRPRSADRR